MGGAGDGFGGNGSGGGVGVGGVGFGGLSGMIRFRSFRAKPGTSCYL